jgi:hypothetical protein
MLKLDYQADIRDNTNNNLVSARLNEPLAHTYLLAESHLLRK